jgi:deoxyhypusine monooxygenase
MGAISSTSALPVLREFANDPERAVRETCEIAVAKIEWDHSEEGKQHHALLAEEEEM